MWKDHRLNIAVDTACCLLLLLVAVFFLPVGYWWADQPLFVAGMALWVTAVFLVCRHACVPWLFRRKRIAWAVLALAALTAGTWLLVRYSENIAPIDDPFDYKTIGRVRRLSIWFLYGITVCLGFMAGSLIEQQRRILEQQRMENERNKAELALYKAQINPHFLFNTLNTLYALVLTQSDKTEEAFMKFADMLRFTSKNATLERIPLSEEIALLTDYVHLQRLRLNEHTQVEFRCDTGQAQTLQIAPMLLITFVENAFKYGVSSHEDGIIRLRLTLQGNRLFFAAENPVRKRVTDEESGGIGIANCRRRLQLLYPERHTLQISDYGTTYRVDLQIELEDTV